MKKIRKVLCILLVICISVIPIGGNDLYIKAAAQKFNIKKEQMLNTVAKYSVGVIINDKEQRFKINKNEISDFKVKSKTYSAKKTKMKVKINFKLDRAVAVISVNATLNYNYQLKKNKWSLKNCTFTKTSISKIALKGNWKGTYVGGQGETVAQFIVEDVTSDGYATGTFLFSPTATNPTVPSGSYSFVGGYDKTTGKVTFAGNEWLNQPDGYSIVDFYGYIDLINKKIVDDNYKLSIKKIS